MDADRQLGRNPRKAAVGLDVGNSEDAIGCRIPDLALSARNASVADLCGFMHSVFIHLDAEIFSAGSTGS